MAEATARHPRVALRYFNGCANWRKTYHLLTKAQRDEGFADVEIVARPHERRRAWGYAAALHPSMDGVAPSPAPRSLRSPHSFSISRSIE